jgi:hypothetical protein
VAWGGYLPLGPFVAVALYVLEVVSAPLLPPSHCPGVCPAANGIPSPGLPPLRQQRRSPPTPSLVAPLKSAWEWCLPACKLNRHHPSSKFLIFLHGLIGTSRGPVERLWGSGIVH